MAAPGDDNVLARRVTDDLIEFSGENDPLQYTKFFLNQKIAECRRQINKWREDADSIRECMAQTTALIAEFEAMPNQNVVHHPLMVVRAARISEQSKLLALNESIAEAMDEIHTLETSVDILDGGNDGV